jgi:hypothetical protein
VAQRRATTGLASGKLGQRPTDAKQFIEDVRQALYASKIVAYAQGFNQIQAGSAEYDWASHPATWPPSGAAAASSGPSSSTASRRRSTRTRTCPP